MQQQNLDFTAAETAAIESTRPLSRVEQFERFDAANPHVYEAIRDRALKLKRHGFTKWSIEEIWNWLRWHWQCRTTGKPYSLNNNYKRFYVDKLLAAEPSLADFFERRQKAAE